MARYIKVNPKVAEYLHLTSDRNKVTDGNYLLWQADMLAFGKLSELPDILQKIGGISLQAHEAREEQDGTVVRKLPTATDSQFVIGNTSSDTSSEMSTTDKGSDNESETAKTDEDTATEEKEVQK